MIAVQLADVVLGEAPPEGPTGGPTGVADGERLPLGDADPFGETRSLGSADALGDPDSDEDVASLLLAELVASDGVGPPSLLGCEQPARTRSPTTSPAARTIDMDAA